MKRSTLIRATLAASGTLALVATAAASPAHAELYNSTCHARYESAGYCFKPTDGNWTAAARAHYEDSGNSIHVHDDAKDGRSAVVQIWPKGYPGKKHTYWNRQGAGTTVHRSLSARENSRWVMRSCLGEWASDPADRRIVSCSYYPVTVYV